MSDFEIAIFEHSDLYDGNKFVPADKVVDVFMQHYKHYLRFADEENVEFTRGRTWLSYRDKSGNDKPMTVKLMGAITDELMLQLKEAVRKVYTINCDECGKEFKDKKWGICETCRNA